MVTGIGKEMTFMIIADLREDSAAPAAASALASVFKI